ncbi:MAG: hypothetical protein R2883_02575 [Caldisericia bacterium]
MCKDHDVSRQVFDVATSDYFRSNVYREIFELIKKVDGKVSELQKNLNGGVFDDELSSVIAGMMVDESINEDEKLFVSQVLNDITRYSLEMLRKKYDNQGLTSEEFELYQRLQREIRGRKNREKYKTEKSEERRVFRRKSGEEKDHKEGFRDFGENQFGETRVEEELEIDEDEDIIFD